MTRPDGLLRQEIAVSRMAMLRAADIAAELSALTGSEEMRHESTRFLHQAARIKELLETGQTRPFKMPESTRDAE